MTEAFLRRLFSGDPAGVLCLYLLLHVIIAPLWRGRGGRPFIYAPIVYFGRALERRLNRPTRSENARFIRGLMVTVFITASAFWIGNAAHTVVAGWQGVGWLLSLFILMGTMTALGPLRRARLVLAHLRLNDAAGAALLLRPYVFVDANDPHGLARKTVELIAVAFCRLFVGPILWFFAGNVTGVLVYSTVAALAAAFYAEEGQPRAFSLCVRVIDAVMNFVPAVITGFLVCFAALCTGPVAAVRAFVLMTAQGMKAGAPWLGIPQAAVAGALKVTLSSMGARKGWIGLPESSARLEAADLARAITLQYAFFFLTTALFFALFITEN